VLELARTTDMTLAELTERIAAERGVAVGWTAVCAFLGRTDG
jgi:transposase